MAANNSTLVAAIKRTSANSQASKKSALATRHMAFAVRSVQAEYLRPAKLDDLIVVETVVESVGLAQVMFAQQVTRAGEQLLDARIRVACIDPTRGKPVPMVVSAMPFVPTNYYRG